MAQPPTPEKVTSLVKRLATQPLAGPTARISYEPARQVSQIAEDGRWVDSWEATTLNGTKKFDVETGEDAKGR
jgi:hypothetical protein